MRYLNKENTETHWLKKKEVQFTQNQVKFRIKADVISWREKKPLREKKRTGYY